MTCFVACTKIDSTPQRALSSYLAADSSGDVNKAYGLLCAGAKSHTTLESFAKSHARDASSKALAKKAKYQVRFIKIEDASAVATVFVELPSQPNESPESVKGRRPSQNLFVLIKEDTGWRIFTGT